MALRGGTPSVWVLLPGDEDELFARPAAVLRKIDEHEEPPSLRSQSGRVPSVLVWTRQLRWEEACGAGDAHARVLRDAEAGAAVRGRVRYDAVGAGLEGLFRVGAGRAARRGRSARTGRHRRRRFMRPVHVSFPSHFYVHSSSSRAWFMP